MKVLIRADVHHRIGYGHLSRCLNLAKELSDHNHQVAFIGRGIESHVKEQYQIYALDPLEDAERTEDTNTWLGTTEMVDVMECKNLIPSEQQSIDYWDWLIVDHYAISWKWEMAMSTIARKIMVIDDLANRKHQCHLLLDQTPMPKGTNLYRERKLVSETCECVLGPEYVLLNSQYRILRYKQWNEQPFIAPRVPRKIMINFGSSDFTNQTGRALQALSSVFDRNPKIKKMIQEVTVVCGHLYKNPYDLLEIAGLLNGLQGKQFKLLMGLTPEKAMEATQNADLCLGAAGVSLYERCCLGVPSILICVADNQEANARNFEAMGVCNYLNKWDEEWDLDRLEELLAECYSDPIYWQTMANGGQNVVDGQGTQRVRSRLEQIIRP